VSASFSLSFDIKRAIKRDAHHLSRISSSRLTEEVMKILSGGYSHQVCEQLQKYKLLIYILPSISTHPHFQEVLLSLKNMDEQICNSPKKKDGKKSINRSEMILALVKPLVHLEQEEEESEREFYVRIYKKVKELISPITPANWDVEHAASEIVKSKGIVVLNSWMKARKPIQRQVRMTKRPGGKRGRYPKIKGASQNSQPRAKHLKSNPTP
jgi:tRNA nucleotidyltransferase/poly(A) polymerase